ncbi:MAG: 1-acyl-sn-glycerol-3-phosphate acyltransferase [Thermomicrobiales bacterium]|nr:1-acyl-sn-glycerol-3-phosphate acyltransferase [Thermomicrobiales bacterium]
MTTLLARLIALLARIASGPAVRVAGDGVCQGQCIFYANHTSHLDVVVLWAVLPGALRQRTRPVAARDYWEKSALRRFAATRIFNAVLVDRDGNLAALRQQLDQLIAALDDGASLIIFPEGTRGSGDEVASFRPGLHFLARQRPDVALVPVNLHNLGRIMPKGEFAPAPQLSRVTFGAPLYLEPKEGKDAFLERARAALIALDAA